MTRARSVRIRLLAIALLPTLVIMPVFFMFTAVNWGGRFDNLLIAKVNGELTIADQFLTQQLEKSDLQIRAVAESAEFVHWAENGQGHALKTLLDAERAALGLDFLYYMNGDGEVLSSPAFACGLIPSTSGGSSTPSTSSPSPTVSTSTFVSSFFS